MKYKPKLAYISFDKVPAPKGAAIHIAAFTEILAAKYDRLELVTVSPTNTKTEKISPNIIHTQLPAMGETLIHRVLYFRALLVNWLKDKQFDIIHFRSIYEGFPIALNKGKYSKYLIFEVNGLPSIELKYRYPGVISDRELMYKIQTQEKICLDAADLILTPSKVTGKYLQSRGVSLDKIRVIPNGVDLDIFTYKFPTRKYRDSIENPLEMLYFGTLAAWQGVNLALEALALVNQEFSAKLTAIGLGRMEQIETLMKLANKLNIGDKLTILPPISQRELVEKMHLSDVIIAPLTANDRNLIQGCCPLKILEGMASGTPVISSDMPVVKDLGENNLDFLLVKPGSAKAIKDALLRLYTEPELAKNLSIQARNRIENDYTWQQAELALVKAYDELIK